MGSRLFAYILKYSKRQQIVLTLLCLSSFPFYYLSLDLPKTIINDAISGVNFPVALSFELAGFNFNFGEFEQVPYLLVLCSLFLLLVLVNSGFKLVINIYRGVLGERMLRRLRLQLIERIMKFPLARFRNTSQGELVSMVNQETEPLGGFIGESFSLPIYQGGLLITILVFMFVQDWKLGLAAIALYPVQAWLIPKLQRQVNLLNQQRTMRMRKLAENLGEMVSGINEIHSNDNQTFFKDHFSKLLGRVFNIRVQIFKKKFFIKFLNNAIAQLTPFLFFLIGGLLVIRGDLSVGALVAALAAYKDLSPPWKELLSWYQAQADARLKFTVLTEQFSVDDRATSSEQALPQTWLDGRSDLPIAVNNVSLDRYDGVREISNVSLSIETGEWIGLIGTGNSGKNGLAQIVARLVDPRSGKLMLANTDAAQLSKSVTGRAVGYVAHDSYLFSTSIRENILLSLKHRPQDRTNRDYQFDNSIEFEGWKKEARLSGNSEVEHNADWIDYTSAGAADENQLTPRITNTLRTVKLEEDLLSYALARTIDPVDHPELANRIVQARTLFREELFSQGLESLVQFLDPDEYNENASLAENILFGASNSDMFSVDGLTEHPVLRSLLVEFDLAESLDAAAFSSASTMIELFADFPPGHEFFERFSIIDADDLVHLKRITTSIEGGVLIDDLNIDDRKMIRSLPYKLISGRHRIGNLDKTILNKILLLRKKFGESLSSADLDQIEFFAADKYNAFSPIAENVIFGRIVYGRLGAEERIYKLVVDVLTKLDLTSSILEIGMSAQVGLGGSLLSVTQRQKIVLARALLKRPRILVVNEGLSALDTDETESVFHNIKQAYPDMSMLWVGSQAKFEKCFDRFAFLESGRITRVENSTAKDSSGETSEFDTKSAPIRSASSVGKNEKLKLLNKIPLFRFLDTPNLKLLSENCDTLEVRKGERVFNQGDAGDALYIVVDGKVSILVSDGETEQQVRICGANESIGEMSLLSEEPRAASVLAISDLVLLRLRRDIFIEMLRANGEIGYQISKVVVDRFHDAKRKAVDST